MGLLGGVGGAAGGALGRVALLLLQGLAWGYYALPGAFQAAAGRLMGRLLRTVGFRRAVVAQNLEIAYPDAPDRVEIGRAFYDHLGRLVWEVLLLLGPMAGFVRRRSELSGLDHWQAARARGRGVIMLASHLGNWEVMSATGAIHGGMDLMLVTKRLKPAWLHRAIEAGRQRCGVLATYEPRTLKDVLAHLKRRGTVGIVLDQYAGPPVGVRVPFFGRTVGTPSIVAALAKRTGAAVLPVINYRDAEGRYRVAIQPALDWEASPAGEIGDEIGRNTARYARWIEADIRQHPAQWLWTHRRFKGDLSPLRSGEWGEGRARK